MAPKRKAGRSQRRKIITGHAIERLKERCGITGLTEAQACGMVQGAEKMFKGSSGEYLLVEEGLRYAVLVRSEGVVRTVLSLEQAFANAPQGVFYILMCTGRMVPAISLRGFYHRGELPPAHGIDQSNYKYPKVKASVIWNAFGWVTH